MVRFVTSLQTNHVHYSTFAVVHQQTKEVSKFSCSFTLNKAVLEPLNTTKRLECHA